MKSGAGRGWPVPVPPVCVTVTVIVTVPRLPKEAKGSYPLIPRHADMARN